MPDIKLYNRDCLEAMKEYPDKYFELAIVDPPYGLGEDGASNHSRSRLANAKVYADKGWDRQVPDVEYFEELKRVSKNQIIWGANHFIHNIPNPQSPCWIIWDKQNGDNDFADCELAYSSFKSAARLFVFRWAGMLQGNMKDKEERIHPTQKPVALYKWLLDRYAKEGDKILDTPLGSGSIAIACYEYGFNLTGFELDPDYYQAAQTRIDNHIKSHPKLF